MCHRMGTIGNEIYWPEAGYQTVVEEVTQSSPYSTSDLCVLVNNSECPLAVTFSKPRGRG